jgi:hypothetical protein
VTVPSEPSSFGVDSSPGVGSIIDHVTNQQFLTIGEFARSTRLIVKAQRIYDDTGRRLRIRHIHAIITEDTPTMFETQTRHVPATRVMSIQRRLHAHETDAFVTEAKAAGRR